MPPESVSEARANCSSPESRLPTQGIGDAKRHALDREGEGYHWEGKTVDDYWDLIVTGDPGADPGPPRPRTRIPEAGEEVVFCVLDPNVTWVRTHYIGGRTQPCLGQMCACVTSSKPLKARWTGYAMAQEIKVRKLCVAVLTEEAKRTCPELADKLVDLHGAKLTVRRRGPRKNGPLSAAVEVGKWPRVGRSPVELREVLKRTWWGRDGGPVTDVDALDKREQYGEEISPPDPADPGTKPKGGE